jgi:two-component system, chemotaxis family, chemotaxis protein CheY
MRVLLADDSRVMRKIIIRTLRQAGYDWQIEQAEDGAQALAMVLAREPDLIISDWNMPNLTGVELLRTLRLRSYRTPFCFVTSEGSEEMRAQATAAGAFGLIAKPFTAESVREALEPVAL